MKCNIKPFYMNLFATAACGLLMGTAFIVILPAGIQILLHGLGNHDEHDKHDKEDHEDHDEDHEDHDEDHGEDDEHEECKTEEFNGPMTGLTVIAGIIFLMFIHSFGSDHSHGHGHKSDNDNRDVRSSKKNFEPVVAEEANIIDAQEDSESLEIGGPSQDKKHAIAPVTLGLLIHAMFDGAALGIVAAGGEHKGISLLVFIAIMGHKAPEAISLSWILLAQGFPAMKLAINLLTFSFAAPVGALVTFFILEAGTESSDNTGEALGYCMLFAGGTFIGVVFEHIVPSLKTSEGERFTWIQLLMFIVGALIPLSLPVDHGH